MERARILFKLLPMSAKRVQQGKPMKSHEVALLKRVFPDTFRLCSELTFEEMMEIDKQYVDHPVYGENIRILLTPEGKAWLKDSLEKIKASK